MDAGKPDTCPNCRAQFVVPGAKELQRENQRKTDGKNRRQAEAERKAKERELETLKKRQEQEALAEARRKAEEEARLQQQVSFEEEHDEILNDESAIQTDHKSNKSRLIGYAVIGVLAFAAVSAIYSLSTKSGAGVTDIVRSSGLRTKLKRCDSYGIVMADAYYDGTISTDVVVFDLIDGGSSTARRIDPVHLLLQFSDELDLYSVRHVILARNGTKKFKIASSDLRPLAESYANGGRPWAFNNLPASVRTMSGMQAYGEWTGGWLGVMQKQAEDLNDFIAAWTGY